LTDKTVIEVNTICRLGLSLAAGVKTNDITKHVHMRRFSFSIIHSLRDVILDSAIMRGGFCYITGTII